MWISFGAGLWRRRVMQWFGKVGRSRPGRSALINFVHPRRIPEPPLRLPWKAFLGTIRQQLLCFNRSAVLREYSPFTRLTSRERQKRRTRYLHVLWAWCTTKKSAEKQCVWQASLFPICIGFRVLRLRRVSSVVKHCTLIQFIKVLKNVHWKRLKH